MNAEQIEKLHTEAQNDLLAGAKAKNIDLQDIIALCQAAERTTAPVSLTDAHAWAIITEICGTQLTRVGSRKFQVVEISDMATAGEVARAILAAAPAPIQKEPVGMEDPIMIPRGLVGAACYLIRKHAPDSKLLEKLRDFTFDRNKKPNADCSGEPANCPDNEGYGCTCDPMNEAGSAKP